MTTSSKITGVWVPGLPHVLKPELHASYKSLHQAMLDVGQELKRRDVKRILYYSTQWISVLGQSVQARPNPKGTHVDENWYQEVPSLKFDFKVDNALATKMVADLSSAGFQTRAVDYEGFPLDTGTIIAESLLNPTKLPSGMFSCCVYSDYAETIKLGATLKKSLEAMDGNSAVVVVSGLSSRYFTTEIDPREDHIRSPEDDLANKKLLDLMAKGSWNEVDQMRNDYCKSTKADMGLKALAFLEGMGVAGTRSGGKLTTKAYGPIYGTGAAVLIS